MNLKTEMSANGMRKVFIITFIIMIKQNLTDLLFVDHSATFVSTKKNACLHFTIHPETSDTVLIYSLHFFILCRCLRSWFSFTQWLSFTQRLQHTSLAVWSGLNMIVNSTARKDSSMWKEHRDWTLEWMQRKACLCNLNSGPLSMRIMVWSFSAVAGSMPWKVQIG